MTQKSTELTGDILKGAVAGAVGWWAMDHLLSFLYNREDPAVREAENEARSGVPALEVMAERIASRAGISLSQAQRERAGEALQWAVPIALGAGYSALRGRGTSFSAGRGLAFGAAVSLCVDEGLTPLLGFAPGPAAFPWQTHARGVAGHLLYGLVAEATLHVLMRKPPRPAFRRRPYDAGRVLLAAA